MAARFNPPPNWPPPPAGWTPPPGWTPDPSWGPVPPGWKLWVEGRDLGPTAASVTPLTSPPGEPALEHAPRSGLGRYKILIGIGAFLLLFAVIGVVNGGASDRDGASARSASTAAEQEDDERSAEEIAADEEEQARVEAERQAQDEADAAAKAEEERLAEEQRLADEAAAAAAAAAEAARVGSVSQQNAYRSAVSYLDYTAFSRTGLIRQLEFEQFSNQDAEFAIARL